MAGAGKCTNPKFPCHQSEAMHFTWQLPFLVLHSSHLIAGAMGRKTSVSWPAADLILPPQGQATGSTASFMQKGIHKRFEKAEMKAKAFLDRRRYVKAVIARIRFKR